MIRSPQATAVLETLLSGKEVRSTNERVTLGPLNLPARQLLKVILDEQNDLTTRRGADQATALRTKYATVMAASKAVPDENTAGKMGDVDISDQGTKRDAVTTRGPTQWRLISLTCQSIRGIAPADEIVTFPLDGLSTLIFGQNGSGKSSLLTAIVWTLTGRVLLDAIIEKESENTAVYRIPTNDKRGSKLCDWPIIATLPVSKPPEPGSIRCYAETELRSPVGQALWVRRTWPNRLETSLDHQTWSPQVDLTSIGISPLDLQLSLIAPTIFGRLTIEQAPDTRGILSLMLGYDDLDTIGELAANLGRNRTSLATKELQQLASDSHKFTEKLSALAASLPEESDLRAEIEALSQNGIPTAIEIAEAGDRISEAVKTAETHLAELLELNINANGTPAGLADQLTTLIAVLEKGVHHVFPSLEALSLEKALKHPNTSSAAERFSEMQQSFGKFCQESQTRIRRRLDWWRKEAAEGSTLAIRLHAAQGYDPELAQCPVCEQSILELPVEQELSKMKAMDRELLRQLNDFFRDLTAELDSIVSSPLRMLGRMTPADQIKQDWNTLRDQTAGEIFASLTNRFETPLLSTADSIVLASTSLPMLVATETEQEFQQAAIHFVDQMAKAQAAIHLLDWSQKNLSNVICSLDMLLTRPAPHDRDSLLSALSKGKKAAEQLKPSIVIRSQIQLLHKERLVLEEKTKQTTLLEEIRPSLGQIKELSKFSVEQVEEVFGSIRTTALSNWSKLYPDQTSGLSPARLHMEMGRNKSVESLLNSGECEVPSQHFANAGLQRAIALSFYFSLLEQHPNGLNFSVLDDPILSLDEEHRESWSEHLLQSHMERIQIIVATHQRQYLVNCRHHFHNGRVIELNPRRRAGRISWKPGDRLMLARAAIENDPTAAANHMRKYKEEMYITFDAFSPRPFFDPSNLSQSAERYAAFDAPHPLSSASQRKIVGFLKDRKVASVLDAGSHALTEPGVSDAMRRQCLEILDKCDEVFREEVKRLSRLQIHERRRASIPASARPFLSPGANATWETAIKLVQLGQAAARPENVTIVPEQENGSLGILPGCAVLVAGSTLDPVARRGQWVLLASEDVPVLDGDLAAITLENEGRLLRRVWSHGDEWQLQSINPVFPVPAIMIRKMDVGMRKIVGVLYEPLKFLKNLIPAAHNEWNPREDFDSQALHKLQVIAVTGNSLDPIARNGQHVLVGQRQSMLDCKLESGGLAVIETSDENVGCVIKRVFRFNGQWVLVSSNPVVPHEPIILSGKSVLGVWPLHGVLFEAYEDQSQ